MDADDGRPFYMFNLMAYRERAGYRPGTALNGSTPTGIISGRDAGWLYMRAVLPELLKRGCYPVFVAGKIRNLLSAGGNTDFFENAAIVRYRSRRRRGPCCHEPGHHRVRRHVQGRDDAHSPGQGGGRGPAGGAAARP